MRWDYFGGGLAVVGIGIALFLGWPPNSWHDVSSLVTNIGVYFGLSLVAIGLPIFAASFPQVRRMWIPIVYVFSISAFIVASVGMYWRSMHAGKLPPHPSVVALFMGMPDAGPYRLMMMNSTGDPLINVSMFVKNAGIFFSLPGAGYKLGDIEQGVTTLPVPPLPAGYYQINLRYRGGGITQMLNITAVDGMARQYSWFSGGTATTESPPEPAPLLPIYSLNPPQTEQDSIRMDFTSIVAPMTVNGLTLEYYSLSATNTGDASAIISLQALTISVDGAQVATFPTQGRGPITKSHAAMFEIAMPNGQIRIPENSKRISASIELLIIRPSTGVTAKISRQYDYDIDWSAGIKRQPKITLN